MTPGPLSILRDTAATHFALPVDVANDYTTFDVNPPLPSGAPAPTYRLRVDAAGEYVTARELKPTLLPEFLSGTAHQLQRSILSLLGGG